MDATDQPNAAHVSMFGRTAGATSDADPIAPDRTRAHSAGMSESEEHLRIQLSEARTDTKFAQLLGEMRAGFAGVNARFDGVDARFDGVDARFSGVEGRFAGVDGHVAGLEARMAAIERATSGIKTTVIGTGVAVVAVMVGILAYGQTWFGIGVDTRDIIRATVSEYVQQNPQAVPVLPQPHAAPRSPAPQTP
jgi:hypothetical protein